MANPGLGAPGSRDWALWPREARDISRSISKGPLSPLQLEPDSDGQTRSSSAVISAELDDQAFFFGKSRNIDLYAVLHKSETHLHPFACFSGCEVQEAQTQCV